MRISKKTLISKAKEYISKSNHRNDFYSRIDDKGIDTAMVVYISCSLSIPEHERKRGDANYRIIKAWLKSWSYSKKISNYIPGLNYIRYKVANDITDGKITASDLSRTGRHSYYKESRGIVSVYVEVPNGYIGSIPMSKYVAKEDVPSMNTTVSISYEELIKALGGNPIKIAGIKLMETGLDIVYK